MLPPTAEELSELQQAQEQTVARVEGQTVLAALDEALLHPMRLPSLLLFC
jgi:hypothetical protein